MYRWVAVSVAGFLQQLAVSYVANGYFFYVTGWIPGDKPPEAVDAKLMGRYGIGCSKWANARRQARGEAKVQYLRHGRFFVLIATAGRHPFFVLETQVRDLRRAPLVCFGYSVGAWQDSRGRWGPSVRLTETTLERVRAALRPRALRASPEELTATLREFRLALYAPVRRQVARLLREVNRARQAASLEPVPAAPGRRQPVRPFASGPVDVVWDTLGEPADAEPILRPKPRPPNP